MYDAEKGGVSHETCRGQNQKFSLLGLAAVQGLEDSCASMCDSHGGLQPGVAASAVLLFWAGPMTPFFPLCVAITLAIKRFFQKRRGGNCVAPKDRPEQKA